MKLILADSKPTAYSGIFSVGKIFHFSHGEGGWEKSDMTSEFSRPDDKKGILQQVSIRLEQIALANSPLVFVAKRSKRHEHSTKTKIMTQKSLKICERPMYFLMEGSDFGKLVNPSNLIRQGENVPSGPKKRKTFRRYLKHERFTHMRGQWIVINTNVLGPTHGISENGKWAFDIVTRSEDL